MLFSKISGFDTSNLEKLPTADRWKIETFSLWGLLSSLACAFSAAYLFKITTHSSITAAIAGITVFFCFLAIQGLLVSNRGEHFGTLKSDDIAIQPSRFNIFIYLLLTVLFTQPLLILISQQIDGDKIAGINKLEHDLKLQNSDNINSINQSHIKNQLARVRENINLLGGNPSLYIAIENQLRNEDEIAKGIDKDLNLSLASRKALVFGNVKYHFGGLRYTVIQAKMMKDKLEKMGFKVTLVLDSTRQTMEYEIDKYAQTLKPGDISFVFFDGHGVQIDKVNYLVPIDDENGYVSINRIMESIHDKKTLVSIFMIEACRSNPYRNPETGFDTRGITNNSFIGLSANAGETTWESGNFGGFFSQSLIKNITANADIASIFNRVKAEVEAVPLQEPQHPTAYSTLEAPITLAIQDIQKGPVIAKQPSKNLITTTAVECKSTSNFNRSATNETDPLLNCISEYLKLRDDLIEDIKLANNSHDELEGLLQEKFSDNQFNPIYFFRYLWSKNMIDDTENSQAMKPVHRSILLSMLIWFLLAGGFILRENMGLALLTYRRFRNEEDTVSLNVYYQGLSKVAKENFSNFQQRLKKEFKTDQLLNQKYGPNLPNPFTEDQDTLDRKNKYVRTGREAFDHLNQALGK